MIVILDTDHLTVIQRQTEPACSHLQARLQASLPDDICTTIVSYEEQMRGWLSLIARAKTKKQEVDAYQRLHGLIEFFADIPVLDYDDDAAERFAHLQRLRLRIGSMDLKIASIAISRGGVLLSCNLKDFQRVPDLRVEEWTK